VTTTATMIPVITRTAVSAGSPPSAYVIPIATCSDRFRR
jgi:hypothetical protein